MVNLEELRAELAEATETANNELAAMTEARQITAKIELMTDPKMQYARVTAEIDRVNTETLDNMLVKAGIIVDSKPVMNDRKREMRKFAPSRYFGLGAQVDKIYQLLTGTLFSAEAHKAQLLALTQVDVNLLEATVEAFGTPESYYNGAERHEIPANVPKLRANLALISTKMDITLDLSNITSTRIDAMFAQSKARAATDRASHQLTLVADSQVLDITEEVTEVNQ